MKEMVRKLKELKAKRVFIQFPEGLKLRIQKMAEELEKEGFECFLCLENCYGACDLRVKEAEMLGADAILHLGHSDFGVKSNIPVIYEEVRQEMDPVPLIKRSFAKLKGYEKICLVTTLQFLDSLEKAKRFLESHGKKVFIGRPSKAKYPGQVLGCDHSAATPLDKKVDCFLFLGSGRFHPLGLGLAVDKPVLFLDLESGRLENLSREVRKLCMIRASRAEWVKDCKSFGILVSTKPGQFKLREAERVKKALEARGKKAYIMVFDQVTPEKLMGLKVDCLVNCCCPRLTEDAKSFGKIILDVGDV